MEWRRDGLLVSTDPDRLDLAAIHAFLTTSYWAEGIGYAVVERSIGRSLCFGLYAADRQIGFARVISDLTTFAYLADVYVLASHRGRGLATWLMECIMSHPDLQGLRRFALATRSAHGLYARFGFTPLAQPERHMEIARPDIYRQTGGPA
jgi:GNAT superfamily N-acetyltransferase